MSTEAVKKFWQKAQQDKALQAKLAAIEEKERQATLAAVIQLGAESGFIFTGQQYDAAIKEELAKQHAARELSDKELADVAGGKLSLSLPPVSLPPPPTAVTACRFGC